MVNIPLHLGKYYRYLWEAKGLLVVIGHFEEFAISKRLYEERHNLAPAIPEGAEILDRIMGAAALAAVSLSDRESWGWTLTLPGSPFGFFCGVEPEGMICGRIRKADLGKGAAYVQRQKGEEPMTQSHYTPDTGDPVEAVARYFETAAQVRTRIALDTTGSGVLVQALPDGRFAEIQKFDNDELIDRFRGMADRNEMKPVGEVLVFYECRCDDEMILDMITGLPDSERRQLWSEKGEITVECPRCGREYVLTRAQGLPKVEA